MAQRRRIQFLIDSDIDKPLKALAAERGVSETRVINAVLKESLLSEEKLTSIVKALARIRGNQDAHERGLFLMFKALEQFVEYFLVLSGPLRAEDPEAAIRDGRRRFEGFVEEFLKRNSVESLPLVMERILQRQEDERSDEPEVGNRAANLT